MCIFTNLILIVPCIIIFILSWLRPAWCNYLVFYYTFFFALHASDVTHIHPQEHRYVHAGGTRKCTCGDLFPGSSSPNACTYRCSWGWMWVTSETCRAKKKCNKTLNNCIKLVLINSKCIFTVYLLYCMCQCLHTHTLQEQNLFLWTSEQTCWLHSRLFWSNSLRCEIQMFIRVAGLVAFRDLYNTLRAGSFGARIPAGAKD